MPAADVRGVLQAGGDVVKRVMNERHSEEQGLRVHHLVNLGGLFAVAGLDREPPDFLLGALVSVAHERDALTPEQRAQVASLGRQKLDERATAKRAWKSWRRQRDLHALTLSGGADAALDRGPGRHGAGGCRAAGSDADGITQGEGRWCGCRGSRAGMRRRV